MQFQKMDSYFFLLIIEIPKKFRQQYRNIFLLLDIKKVPPYLCIFKFYYLYLNLIYLYSYLMVDLDLELYRF